MIGVKVSHLRGRPSEWFALSDMMRIEARRSIGRAFFPAIAVLAGFLAAGSLAEIPLWIDTSIVVRDTALVLGPVLAGAAAWMAGRERVRGMEELLESTARPAGARTLTTAAATTLWGVLAYAVVAAGLIGWTYFRGAWGEPPIWPIVTGLLTVLACASLGYALGAWLHSRFTAPLVAVALFSVLYFPVGLPETSPLHWLTPTIRMEGSVYYGLFPNLGLEHSVFLTGLALASLAAAGLRRARKSPVAWGITLAGSFLVAVGAGMVWAGGYRAESMFAADLPVIPHTPICNERRPVAVCVHPAYKSLLEDLSAHANWTLEPLLGLPGVPERLEQGAVGMTPEEAGGTLTFADGLTLGPAASSQSKLSVISSAVPVYDLVVDLNNPAVAATGEDARKVQDSISYWLYNRGNPFPCKEVSGNWRTICEAAERFEQMQPTRQRAWLEENWADLRAGKLGMEDLP